MTLEQGSVFRVKYPFIRCEVDVPSDIEQGYETIKSWQPGTREEWIEPDDQESVCDDEGEMVLTVVDVFKPTGFPQRVFFTRRWVDPEGKEFGKGKLHIMTAQAFNRRARGYMHEYTIVPLEALK